MAILETKLGDYLNRNIKCTNRHGDRRGEGGAQHLVDSLPPVGAAVIGTGAGGVGGGGTVVPEEGGSGSSREIDKVSEF